VRRSTQIERRSRGAHSAMTCGWLTAASESCNNHSPLIFQYERERSPMHFSLCYSLQFNVATHTIAVNRDAYIIAQVDRDAVLSGELAHRVHRGVSSRKNC
jgi:hypothetical protein